MLVTLNDSTNSDEDLEATIFTRQGPPTVRAGDFFLAKGIKSEVWLYPKQKVDDVMTPAL